MKPFAIFIWKSSRLLMGRKETLLRSEVCNGNPSLRVQVALYNDPRLHFTSQETHCSFRRLHLLVHVLVMLYLWRGTLYAGDKHLTIWDTSDVRIYSGFKSRLYCWRSAHSYISVCQNMVKIIIWNPLNLFIYLFVDSLCRNGLGSLMFRQQLP